MAFISKYATAKGPRYRVRYTTPDGRKTERRGFETKKSAELWKSENVVKIATGDYIDPALGKRTVDTFIRTLLSRKGSRSKTTLANRESHAKNWVLPYWTSQRVVNVTPDAVAAWVQWMRDEDAKEPTIAKAYQVLSGAMRIAVEQKCIMKSPVGRLTHVQESGKARNYLTHGEVDELAGAIDAHYGLLVRVLAYTGLRFGEAAALRAGDVDLASRRLIVTRSITEVKGVLVESGTKSREGRRVPIPPFLVSDLKDAITGKKPDEHVFMTPRGNVIRLNTWRRRTFKPAIDAINSSWKAGEKPAFRAITPHDLRHTAVSLAIQAGANVKLLQRMLGHKDASMTLNTYADLFEDDLDEVSERLSKAREKATRADSE